MKILHRAELGTPVSALFRENGMRSATLYKWRTKYDGMDTSIMACRKEFEAKKRQFKIFKDKIEILKYFFIIHKPEKKRMPFCCFYIRGQKALP